MDHVDQNTVEELKWKVKQLMDQYENIKSHNGQLLEENKNLKKELKQKDIELANCQDKLSKRKLAASMASVDSPHDAKIKINRIVREIDKCIALLNK